VEVELTSLELWDGAVVLLEVKEAGSRFIVIDYLLFDRAKEPPPSDIPADYQYDNVAEVEKGIRSDTVHVRAPDVRMDASITTYTGDRYGTSLGAPSAASRVRVPQRNLG